MIIVLSITIGVIVGFFTALLFLQFDKTWKKALASAVELGTGSAAFPAIAAFFGMDAETVTNCLAALFISFILCFLVSFYILCQIIKRQNDELARIRTADILLNYPEFLKGYYDTRMSQNPKIVDRKQLEREVETLEEEKALLQRCKEEVSEQLSEAVCLL